MIEVVTVRGTLLKGCVRASVGCARLQYVEGSQERLTRCFREVEVASQQHKKVAKMDTRYSVRLARRSLLCSNHGYVTDKKRLFNIIWLAPPRIFSSRS